MTRVRPWFTFGPSYHVAGQHDLLVHVVVRDANYLRDLAMDALTSHREVGPLHQLCTKAIIRLPVLTLRRLAR